MENWRAKRISGTSAAAASTAACCRPAATRITAITLAMRIPFSPASLALARHAPWAIARTLGPFRSKWNASRSLPAYFDWQRVRFRGKRASALRGDERIAQGAEAGEFHLDHVTGREVRRAAVRADPDDVAGVKREITAHRADVPGDAEDHVVGAKAQSLLAVAPHDGLELVEVDLRVDPGAHGLEGVAVLGAPERAVGLLPHALAHVVADGVAEHAGEGVCLAQVLGLPADDDDQLALVLHLGGIPRDDDRLTISDQRVDRAIADVGLLGQVGLDAVLGGHLADVLGVVEADAVEGGRHDRHLDLHRPQVAHDLGALVAGEGIARHLDDAVAFEDAVAGAALMRIPDPTHGSSPCPAAIALCGPRRSV